MGRRGIGVAVSGLLARRRAVDLSAVVTFGGNGRLHCQRSSYRNAEHGENCLSHGHLPLSILQKVAECGFRGMGIATVG
jgi:hypothetical protein